MRRRHRTAVVTVAVSMLAISSVSVPTILAASRAVGAPGRAWVDPRVTAQLASLPAGATTTVILTMRDHASVGGVRGTRAQRLRAVVGALRAQSTVSQAPVQTLLAARGRAGRVKRSRSFWVFNGLSVTATADVINELAARPDVERIAPDAVAITPLAIPPTATPEPNITLVNAPAVWNLGAYGQGVVVADLDTGVDRSNPDLAASYRGGSNSWFDPYGQHTAAPVDMNGHGSATTAIMVGAEDSGVAIGVAPGAKWIAARIFNDAGSATATAIHQAFQWTLDPDGNPATADAPAFVNNSWGLSTPGCDLSFQPDLQALRAAGIVPVFSAGNSGPGASTSVSPANLPEALAVGVTDNADVIDAMSARGPSACGEASTTFPELVAPGINVLSADRFGLYSYWSGTSLSAPHVTGALALLRSAFGAGADVEAAVRATAVDLGAPGPDNVYGLGRIDVLAAYQWLVANPPPTTTTTSTSTTTTTTTSTTTTTTTTTVPPTTTTSSTTTTTTVPPTTTTSSTTTTVPATTTTTTPPPPVDAIFSDGFETGTFSAWSATATNNGHLTVTAAAALKGAYGMQANIVNTGAMIAADRHPTALRAYRARFHFSPNGVIIPATTRHWIFTTLDAANRFVQLVELRAASGAYQVRVGTRLNNGTYAYTTWRTLTNAHHSLETRWTAASSNTATDGKLSLWLDGVLVRNITTLANGTTRVDTARLGPQSISAGTTGTEYFDAFASTRTSSIGP